MLIERLYVLVVLDKRFQAQQTLILEGQEWDAARGGEESLRRASRRYHVGETQQAEGGPRTGELTAQDLCRNSVRSESKASQRNS